MDLGSAENRGEAIIVDASLIVLLTSTQTPEPFGSDRYRKQPPHSQVRGCQSSLLKA